MSESGKYFNEISGNWDQDSMRNHIAHMVSRSIHKYIPPKKNSVMLDFGCGTGLVSFFFYPHLSKLDGYDTSEGMVNAFNKKAAENNFANAQGFIYNESDEFPEEKYDVIISSMVFHHIENPANALRKLFAALKPGGEIGIADLDEEDGTFHPPEIPGVFHKGFQRSKMLQWFSDAGFTQCHCSTAVNVEKNGKSYPIFLCSGKKL
jgi:ubiquinone/menaquinone biosynthesis C-methylase UbiE